MSESENTGRTSISKAQTLDEIAEFRDTHSLADYWDSFGETAFRLRLNGSR